MVKTAFQIDKERKRQEQRDKAREIWEKAKAKLKERRPEEEQPAGIIGTEEYSFNQEQQAKKKAEEEQASVVEEKPIEQPIEQPIEGGERTVSAEQQLQFAKDNPGSTIDEFGNVTPKDDGKTTDQDRAEIEAMQAGGELYADRQAAKAEAEQLSGQVGQYDPLAIDQDSSLDYKEAAITGLVDFIPRAITGIGSLALLRGTGLVGGAGGAATAGRLLMGVNPWVAGAAIIAGITASMISNFKSQRRDTTTAQQRVLDEGKQSLQDWSTQAAADPANKMMYLAEFNKQLAQIDQADRQMKWDTAHDILKFETAIPNKAEFIAFYSVGGERDALIADMRLSIGGGQDPQVIQYKMLELAERYDES